MPRWQHSSMKCAPLSADSGEQDAVVGDDADRVAVDAREAGDQRGAVARLELVELASRRRGARSPRARRRACAGRPGRRRRARAGVVQRRRGSRSRERVRRFQLSVRDDPARERQRVGVVSAKWSATPDCARVHVAAAQLLGGDHLAGGGLHQRRAAEEDRALVLDDDRSRRSSPARRRRRRCTSPSPRRSAGCPRADMLAWL